MTCRRVDNEGTYYNQFCYNRPVKNLFLGKKAILTVPITLIVALALLPFVIGVGLGYFAYKKIPNAKLRLTSIGAIAIMTLFIGNAWVSAISSSGKLQTEPSQKLSEEKTEEAAVLSETTTASPSSASQANRSKGKEAQIIKVVDGDTVTVSIDGMNETVRIIGINTPETVDPRKPIECFGQKASDKAKEVLTGKTVQLEPDITQGELDKYNRLLRYIWFENGAVDFGAMMIQEGYAYEYTYGTPYAYQAKYKEFQKEAEQNKRGLWEDNACPNQTNTSESSTAPQNKSTNSNTPQSAAIYSNSGDKDCPDFKTHAEAQAYFNSKGGSPSNNVDNLDADHDGIACETLP